MQYLFKTHYNDDIRFLAKTGEKVRVGLVVLFLILAPLLLQDYYLAELGLLLVYVIAGVGLSNEHTSFRVNGQSVQQRAKRLDGFKQLVGLRVKYIQVAIGHVRVFDNVCDVTQ